MLLQAAVIGWISLLATSLKISDTSAHKVRLRLSDPDSLWCYAATMDPERLSKSKSIDNILATQVWPSARAAACALEKYLLPAWTVCELGCGPALPSLASAKVGAKTIATDFDAFALELAQASAVDQCLDISTQIFDLRSLDRLPKAKLYVMSDVFESSCVAKGAAFHTVAALKNGASVWVFAQNDRVQREVFLRELQNIIPEEYGTLEWSASFPSGSKRLWLCDVDENTVPY